MRSGWVIASITPAIRLASVWRAAKPTIAATSAPEASRPAARRLSAAELRQRHAAARSPGSTRDQRGAGSAAACRPPAVRLVAHDGGRGRRPRVQQRAVDDHGEHEREHDGQERRSSRRRDRSRRTARRWEHRGRHGARAYRSRGPRASCRRLRPRLRVTDPARAAALREAWRALWVSRAVVWAAGVGVLSSRSGDPGTWRLFDPSAGDRAVRRPWATLLVAPAARWDAAWYLGIARDGYSEPTRDGASSRSTRCSCAAGAAGAASARRYLAGVARLAGVLRRRALAAAPARRPRARRRGRAHDDAGCSRCSRPRSSSRPSTASRSSSPLSVGALYAARAGRWALGGRRRRARRGDPQHGVAARRPAGDPVAAGRAAPLARRGVDRPRARRAARLSGLPGGRRRATRGRRSACRTRGIASWPGLRAAPGTGPSRRGTACASSSPARASTSTLPPPPGIRSSSRRTTSGISRSFASPSSRSSECFGACRSPTARGAAGGGRAAALLPRRAGAARFAAALTSPSCSRCTCGWPRGPPTAAGSGRRPWSAGCCWRR